MEIFHFDIKTVGAYPDFDTFKSRDKVGSKLFESKFNRLNWEEKYSQIWRQQSINDAYISNSPLISTYGKIVCISFGTVSDSKSVIKSICGEERDIVNEFNDILKRVEKKSYKLCGFKILSFDIPWILHKLHKYGIKPASIINTHDKKPWELRLVDMSEDWKSRFINVSFDEMTYELGIGIPDEIEGDKIHNTYWSGDIESIKRGSEDYIAYSIEAANKIYLN